jgi:hypothetical protein
MGYGCTKLWLENVVLKDHSNSITLHKFYLFEWYSMVISNLQDQLNISPSVNGVTWGVIPHALKRHGTIEVLFFNGYGAQGFLVPHPWSTLDGKFGINCTECS